MSSYDGSRSARQSKRYSMSALYMSMSANESDLVIEDDLAKGAPCRTRRLCPGC
jgi:Ras GTPase-activating-like protein IQGAP2/3